MASIERDLEARIGHAFARPGLLVEALTHASLSERQTGAVDYERLEFLGDRVLGLVIAEHLHRTFPREGEGALVLRLNALVNRDACARAARRVDLGAALRLAPSEDRTGGRNKDTILADACEALIAAIYLDAGYEAARAFIARAWGEDLTAGGKAPVDPKTALQEWAAQRGRPNPLYEVVARSGPDHAPEFEIEARVDGLESERARGPSKRDAEREAARRLLRKVGINV